MTIGSKIIGGYAFVLVMMAIATFVSIHSLAGIQLAYDGFMDVDQRLVEETGKLRIELSEQIANYRGILLYPDQKTYHLKALQANRQRFNQSIDSIRQHIRSDEEHALLQEIVELQIKNEQVQDQVIDLAQKTKRKEALALGILEVRPLNRMLGEKMNHFREYHLKLLAEGHTELVASVNRAMLIIWSVLLLALAVALTVGFLSSRSITRKLRESIVQLTSSSHEILAATTQVAAGAAETATAVNETTTTVKEVKQTARLAGQKAQYVSDSAQKIAQISQSGHQSVNAVIAGMFHIQEQMELIAESIVGLSEQSLAIGEIITSVNDLAEQSSLLAVNAAIEATRAGEQGKGFGVVAQEVKSLAEQSKQATGQVRSILGSIQKATHTAVLAAQQGHIAVEAGMKQADETREAIEHLAESIQEAAQAATQIAVSSQQQMAGMDQVVLAMENIKLASAQNVEGSKQAKITAKNLHALGHQLSAMIGSKTVDIAI